MIAKKIIFTLMVLQLTANTKVSCMIPVEQEIKVSCMIPVEQEIKEQVSLERLFSIDTPINKEAAEKKIKDIQDALIQTCKEFKENSLKNKTLSEQHINDISDLWNQLKLCYVCNWVERLFNKHGPDFETHKKNLLAFKNKKLAIHIHPDKFTGQDLNNEEFNKATQLFKDLDDTPRENPLQDLIDAGKKTGVELGINQSIKIATSIANHFIPELFGDNKYKQKAKVNKATIKSYSKKIIKMDGLCEQLMKQNNV